MPIGKNFGKTKNKMDLSDAINKVKVDKIQISNRKMNRILKENGIHFKIISKIDSVVLERKKGSKFIQ